MVVAVASRATAPDPALVAALRAELSALRVETAAQRADLDTLGARITRLEAGRGPRDTEDCRLLAAIDEAAEGLPWRCSDVLARARDVPLLAVALRNADITSAKELGKWCSRLVGVDVNGAVLVRVRPRLWRVSHV